MNEIVVTQKHIDDGIIKHCCSCPVALATTEIIKNDKYPDQYAAVDRFDCDVLRMKELNHMNKSTSDFWYDKILFSILITKTPKSKRKGSEFIHLDEDVSDWIEEFDKSRNVAPCIIEVVEKEGKKYGIMKNK